MTAKLVGTFRYTQHEMNLMILGLACAMQYGRDDLKPKYAALREQMLAQFSTLPPDRNPITMDQVDEVLHDGEAETDVATAGD